MDRSHKGKSESKAVTEPNNQNHQSTSSAASQSSISENLDAEFNPSTTGVSSQTSDRAEGLSANESGTTSGKSKAIKVSKSSTIEDPEAKSEGTASVAVPMGGQQTQPKVATTPANTGTTANTISPRNGQQGRGRLRGTSVGASESGNHRYKQPGPSHINDSSGKPTTSAKRQQHQKNAGGRHISRSSSNYLTEMEVVHEESTNVGTTEMVDGDETVAHEENSALETTQMEDQMAAHEESSTLLCAQPIQPGSVNAREETRNAVAVQPSDAEAGDHLESTRFPSTGVTRLYTSGILANARGPCNCYQPEAEAQVVPDTIHTQHNSFPSVLSTSDIAIFVTVTDIFQGEIQDVRIHAISYRTLPVMLWQGQERSVRPDEAMMRKTFE